MNSSTNATNIPAPGYDFTGAKIANLKPGRRVRTWTGELGEVQGLGGARRGMCPLEQRVYQVRLDGETTVYEWAAWMLTENLEATA
jgi:hypothetical protein